MLKQMKKNKSSKYNTIPIIVNNFNDGKILTINVKINNRKCNLLLDSGSSISVIDLRKLDKFTSIKPKKSQNMSSINKDIDTFDINISKFEIGDLIIENRRFYIMDLINLNNTLSTNYINVIDGIIGNDLLFKLNSIINLNKETLKIKKPD